MASYKVILILLFLLLVGCASTTERWCFRGSIDCKYWEYSDCERVEGKSCQKEWIKFSNQSIKDRADCEKDRSRTTYTWKKKEQLKDFESCMESKGYTKIKKGIDMGKLYLQMVMFPIEMFVCGIYSIPAE